MQHEQHDQHEQNEQHDNLHEQQEDDNNSEEETLADIRRRIREERIDKEDKTFKLSTKSHINNRGSQYITRSVFKNREEVKPITGPTSKQLRIIKEQQPEENNDNIESR